jgi:dihydroorotate dehydrogenase
MLYPLLRSWLFRLDAETAHHFAFLFLQLPLVQQCLRRDPICDHPTLTRQLWQLTFPNPVGVAAGFDKNAVALPAWEKLGFGFVEIGTITRHPQAGNPRPRIFRLPQQRALINRLGFPNQGADAVAARLAGYRKADRWPRIPVGINIGKSKITPLEEAAQDYLYSFQRLREFADYVVINVSSPNTPGLRTLQGRDQLEKIVHAVQNENSHGKRVPLLVKISPDLTEEQLQEIVEVVQENGCDGLVATNTTLDKSGMPLQEEGGLSGQPLRCKSTAMLLSLNEKTQGRLPLIGMGGIFTAADVTEKISAGASLVQLYTGFVYEGPGLLPQLCRQLAKAAA